MAILEDRYTASIDVARAAVRAVPTDPAAIATMPADALLAVQRSLAEIARIVATTSSLFAGEIAHRSRKELGYAGLAQREGFRTPEALIRDTTGSTSREAFTLVQVGTMARDAVTPAAELAADGVSAREPWLADVGAAVAAGALSPEAAAAIRSGLGSPSDSADAAGLTSADLAGVARALLREASDLHIDRLRQRARELRDELDAAGIAHRERMIHQERSIRRVRRPNGLNRYIVDPDLESAAFWDDLYDTITSPRRGGPRFVDEDDRAWAESIVSDTRTTEQLTHDAFTQLLRSGAEADGTRLGARPPAVRVLVTAETLETRSGHGRIDDISIPVSVETIERIACEAGTVPIAFDDDGQALNLGREQRTFTARQRVVLAARDGGCMFGDCDRPPSWCEAHHIRHWHRDHGRTDIADGILLCRHHHMLVHNNEWEIERRSKRGMEVIYWLIPPADIDPARMPRPMPSKSAALRDLRAS